MKNLLREEDLEHVGKSLITIKGTNCCLGDLIHFEDKGVFCPNNGRVPVSGEAADIHNKALDKAKIKGLDEQCEVGQGGMFYFSNNKKIITFIGTVISEGPVVISGTIRRTVYFSRKGKKFKGIIRKNEDCIWIKRIS